jgi:hypothetical protein
LHVLFETLLDGQKWSWTFIPEGYRLVALASLPALCLAAARRGARWHAAGLALVGLGMLLPTTYETFLVNRLRYLWPFSGPWLLGLSALGELLLLPLSRRWPKLIWLGLLVPGLAGFGFAKLAPISVADVAQSAAAITAQQVSLGRWAAEQLPKAAKIGLNDAGAIAFYSGRQTFDIVGLTTRGEARYWVGGAGSRFEHYERMPRSELPTHFFVYPEWFGIPGLLGERLTERRVEGATILGGPLMVACLADYSSLGSGALPVMDTGTRRLLDEVDVADLESEAAHGYQLALAAAHLNVVETREGRADGGREYRSDDRFQLELQPGGLLILRLSTLRPTTFELSVAGQRLTQLRAPPGSFQELSFELPASLRGGRQPLVVQSQEQPTLLHYWSFGRVL